MHVVSSPILGPFGGGAGGGGGGLFSIGAPDVESVSKMDDHVRS